MTHSSHDPFTGQHVGMYRVERLLGRGQVNAVYLAHSSTHNSPVALTTFVLPEKFSFDARQRFLRRFHKEATRLTALQHPHILPVYDYGEYAETPYLITPYITNGSLANILKRQGRLQHAQVLDILQQVVAGLSYAHKRGVFHGALKPANIILNHQQQMLVAGFGLTQILQMRGIMQDEEPYGHLFSIDGTFLTSAQYLAPEQVQGQAGDARTDVYSLGMILFELLSGKTPFRGTDPLEIAKQHVQQPVLSLRTYNPDIPLALAAVVNQALDRDPARRFQQVEELAEAFVQVSAALPYKSTSDAVRTAHNAEFEETPAVGYTPGNWQLLPPVVTNKLPALDPPAQKTRSQEQTRLAPPVEASPTFASSSDARAVSPSLSQSESRVTSKRTPEAIYDLWVPASQRPTSSPRSDTTRPRTNPRERFRTSIQRTLPFEGRQVAENKRVSRRSAVALLAAAGSVAIVGTVVAINLSSNTPNQQAQNPPPSNPQTPQLAKNAATNFNNNASVLVHLANGNFVAYNRHCTHVGVLVDYDPATQLLVCPAHGATFDPAQDGAVQQGPATKPLPKATFHINADGTITA